MLGLFDDDSLGEDGELFREIARKRELNRARRIASWWKARITYKRGDKMYSTFLEGVCEPGDDPEPGIRETMTRAGCIVWELEITYRELRVKPR